MKIRTYKKDLPYSYTLGVFLTIELLNNRPSNVLKVLLHNKANNSTGVSKIITLCKKHNIEYDYNDRLISVLSNKDNCFAVGIFTKYEETLGATINHLVLVNPSDSGNLGTIIRTALGFGITNLALVRPAVDIFDPKTIRASMGALFRISFKYYNTFSHYYQDYQDHQAYPFMLEAKTKLSQVDIIKPYALIFGNEGSGLPNNFSEIGTSLVIPHKNTIDSLNLSVAVAIALYEFSKS